MDIKYSTLEVTCKEAEYLLPKRAFIAGTLPAVVGSSISIQCSEGTVTKTGHITQSIQCQKDHSWLPSRLLDCEGTANLSVQNTFCYSIGIFSQKQLSTVLRFNLRFKHAILAHQQFATFIMNELAGDRNSHLAKARL